MILRDDLNIFDCELRRRRILKISETHSFQVCPCACEDIDGWLELRFPGNLQGYNTDRYAEHMAMREEESQAQSAQSIKALTHKTLGTHQELTKNSR